MNTKSPTTPHVARHPCRSATSLMPSVVGTAAGLCRKLVGRHLPHTEPQRLMFSTVAYSAFATSMVLAGGVGYLAGAWLVPSALMGLAATAVAQIRRNFDDLAECERHTAERHESALSKLRIQKMMLQLENHELRKFHAAGDLEGAPARSGAAAGNEQDRKQPFPAAEAPNVLRPQFPDFRRH